MKLVVSKLALNSNVRAALKGLSKAKIISKFYTSIGIFPKSVPGRLSQFRHFSILKGRTLNTELKPIVKTRPTIEIPRLLSIKTRAYKLTNKNPFDLDTVNYKLDSWVSSCLGCEAKEGATAFYGYEDTSLLSFATAKDLGLKCLYDLPIAYWRHGIELLETEKKRWPDWAGTMNLHSLTETHLARKDEELRLADKIFVASQFTAETLATYPANLAPIEVIPYGFPDVNRNRRWHTIHRNRPLKLLFVGILTQRKGIANLFDAVNQLGKHVTLTVVGSQQTTNSCQVLNNELRKHTWYPQLSRTHLLSLMSEYDVLVFPSLFEGFGLVITEAMSQGTPVITTERTGGRDIITNGENGWLVEAGSTSQLKAAIEKLLCKPQLIAKAAKEALETAKGRPWEQYGRELSASVMGYQTLLK